MPQDLEIAASSAIPQGGTPPFVPEHKSAGAEILKLLQSMSGGGLSGPMTTMQPSSSMPSMPAEYHAPAGGGEVAQGGFASTGARKRADAQAMIHNLASLSKSITDYQHEKKVREYSTTIEKVMNSQQGMQEAQAQLEQAQQAVKANPQDTAAIAQMQRAQDALQHNQEILSQLGQDPKVAKILEKAFSVKLIGDDKGKASPEYQALNQAIKSKNDKAKKEAGLQMMEKFAKTQPMRQQISPQYQAMAQLIKDKVLPEANKQMEQQTEVAKELIKAQQKGYDNESREKIADLYAQVKDRATQAMIQKQLYANIGRMGAAEIMASASIKRASIMANAAQQDTQWRMAGEILKKQADAKGSKAQNALFNNLSKEHQRITDEIKDAQKQLGALGTDTHWYQLPSTNKKIQDIQTKLNDLRQEQQTIIQKMGQLNFGGANVTGTPTTRPTDQDSGFAEFDRFFEQLVTEPDASDEDSN